MTDAGGEEDFGNTSEVPAFDDEMLESTAARPQSPSEVSTASSLGKTDLNPPHLRSPEESQEAIVVDDLADLEVVDEEEEAPPTRDDLGRGEAEAKGVVDTAAVEAEASRRGGRSPGGDVLARRAAFRA